MFRGGRKFEDSKISALKAPGNEVSNYTLTIKEDLERDYLLIRANFTFSNSVES